MKHRYTIDYKYYYYSIRRKNAMTLRNDPVPLPAKRITYKKGSNGIIYIYYTLRAYRNTQGKPTSDEVVIGKKDPVTGMLIPNKKYFELFPETISTKRRRIESVKNRTVYRVENYGTIYALMKIAEKIGLQAILSNCFPRKWEMVLLVAIYMICEGNVMMYIKDWCDETLLFFTKQMDDQQCSVLFANITFDERMIFFEKWVQFRSEQEHIAYDVTSVSTYSNGIDIAEYGYNRDNEKIPQVNIGMYYGVQSCLPVYYNVYSGSISDKSHMPCMLHGTKKLGIENSRFVFDRIFVTKDNMEYCDKERYFFISAFPNHFVETRRLIDECKDVIHKSENRVKGSGVYGVPITTEVYGFTMTACVYFDPKKQALDEAIFYSHIDRLEADLEKMKKTKRVTKRFTDYFNVEQESDENICFKPDNEKMNERLSRAGFFVLLSNDNSLDCGTVLKTYRRRDSIEKNFHQLKNELDFKRLRTHVNETMDGKIFTGFIALIIRSYILTKIKNNDETKKFTFEKILIELRKIKVITYNDGTRMIQSLTKTQKTILKALDLTEEELLNSLD